MAKNVLIINGHPDPSGRHFCAALADAYGLGAASGGHAVRRLDVGALNLPLIRSEEMFTDDEPPPAAREAQAAIAWADHLVLVFPLWLGAAPAALKGFLEQTFRYGFAITPPGQRMRGLLAGRSARIVVTMGMPGPVFRWVFGAFGVRSLARGILWISGVRPIRRTLIGEVAEHPGRRRAWLRRMHEFGARAA